MSAAVEMAEPRGRLVEIGGGRRLRAVPAGPAASPRPLALLEAGSFGFSADWAAVQALLAAEGVRSLAYDRAGLGVSEPGPEPRDSRAIVDDLEALLAAVGERGPYVVVGHSMAGMHVRLFACRNPQKIHGLVLVDATTPEAMDHPVVPHIVNQYAALSKMAAWGSNAGLARPLAGVLGDGIGLPPDAKAEKKRAFADPIHNHWAAVEVAHWRADAEQSRAAGVFDPGLAGRRGAHRRRQAPDGPPRPAARPGRGLAPRRGDPYPALEPCLDDRRAARRPTSCAPSSRWNAPPLMPDKDWRAKAGGMDAALKLDGVTKRYGAFTAVRDLSYQAQPGRILGFLGPNGAGKTTTLRMILGLIAPTAGRVEVLGETDGRRLRGRVGFLPEERGLYRRMTPVGAIAFFASPEGHPARRG